MGDEARHARLAARLAARRGAVGKNVERHAPGLLHDVTDGAAPGQDVVDAAQDEVEADEREPLHLLAPAGVGRNGAWYYGDHYFHPRSQSRYTAVSLMDLTAFDAEEAALVEFFGRTL